MIRKIDVDNLEFLTLNVQKDLIEIYFLILVWTYILLFLSDEHYRTSSQVYSYEQFLSLSLYLSFTVFFPPFFLSVAISIELFF